MDVRCEIGILSFRVRKWVQPRVVLDSKIGSILWGVLEANDGFEVQRRSFSRKIDQCYAIPENVMYPSRLGRFRRYLEMTIEQTLIETISRPEHQLM